jgi:hypothetical protein
MFVPLDASEKEIRPKNPQVRRNVMSRMVIFVNIHYKMELLASFLHFNARKTPKQIGLIYLAYTATTTESFSQPKNSLHLGTFGLRKRCRVTHDFRNVKYWNLNWKNNLASLFIRLGVDSFRDFTIISIVLIHPGFAQNRQKLTDHFKDKVVILKHLTKEKIAFSSSIYQAVPFSILFPAVKTLFPRFTNRASIYIR